MCRPSTAWNNLAALRSCIELPAEGERLTYLADAKANERSPGTVQIPRGCGWWGLERGPRSERMSLHSVLAEGCLLKESPSVAKSEFSVEENIPDFSLKFSDLSLLNFF